jgi:hypothetical protein
MNSQGKWVVFAVFLIGVTGALAHDVFGFSKLTVVMGFAIVGVGILLSLLLRSRA